MYIHTYHFSLRIGNFFLNRCVTFRWSAFRISRRYKYIYICIYLSTSCNTYFDTNIRFLLRDGVVQLPYSVAIVKTVKDEYF